MMKLIIVLIFILINTNTVLAQNKVEDRFYEGWEDIKIEKLNSPLHKMTGVKNHLWSTDYGNGFIYKSINNGINWTRVAELESEYFETIQFLNKKIGYVSGDYGYVYKTEDGGITWKEISPQIKNRIKERYRNDSNKNQKPNGFFVAYYSMYFTNKKNGYVSGFKVNPKKGFRESSEQIFFSTKDGGESWTLLNKEQQSKLLKKFKSTFSLKNITIDGIYYLNKNNSWKTALDREKNSVIIHNKGKYSTSDTLKLSKPKYNRTMLRSIVFKNDTEGFIFGGSFDENNQKAMIYKTLDKGESWSLIDSSWPHIHFGFKHNNYLWVSGKNGLLKRKRISKIN